MAALTPPVLRAVLHCWQALSAPGIQVADTPGHTPPPPPRAIVELVPTIGKGKAPENIAKRSAAKARRDAVVPYSVWVRGLAAPGGRVVVWVVRGRDIAMQEAASRADELTRVLFGDVFDV
jgi:hypothetical protein